MSYTKKDLLHRKLTSAKMIVADPLTQWSRLRLPLGINVYIEQAEVDVFA